MFTDRVLPIEGSLDLLQGAGFIQQKLANPDGVEEEYLVFDDANYSVDALPVIFVL